MASSDPKIATQGQWEDLASRIKAKADASDIPIVDTGYNASSNNAIANSTVTNSLNRDVVTNIALDTNPSTTSVNINNTKTNLATPSSTTTTAMPLPVASTTQAGVINSATFNAITKNTQDIANIVGEVVAITGLPASPTQAELTTAWLNASGEPALINGAGIYDVTNTKRWTYYSNDTTWHALDASGSVTVNQWTNSSAGIVKGSTNIGQIFAENDGTGSVNGWDGLSGTVSNNTSKLATIEQGAEVNEVEIGAVVSTPSSVEYVDTDNIANEAVTTAKIDLGAVTTSKIADDAVTTSKIADDAITSDKIDFTTLAYGSSRYTSSQNISAGTTTKVVFQENVYTDTDGVTYDNGEFTIQKDGFWYISTEVGGHSNGQCTVEIRVNDIEYISQRNYSPQVQYISTSGCYKLKAGDKITIMVTGTNAWTINSRAKGNINISLVSPIN